MGETSLRFRSHLGQAAVLSLLVVLSLPFGCFAETDDELRSATLLAFLRNARWADQPAAGTPLTVGVVGRTAFFRWLRTSVEGKSIEGRPLRVLEVKAPFDPHCCQLLYFATDKLAQINPILSSVSSEHVLTVGETDSFLEQGGAVGLFPVDGHMAFEVSLGALDRSGVQISSKLLRFGQIRDIEKGRGK